MHRCIASLCVALVCLFAVPSYGEITSPRRLALDEGRFIEMGGGTYNLPLGPSVTAEEAIAHAYTMPAVQAAIQEMLARGYVPHASYDEAVSTTSPPLTMVTLAFEKPGLYAPPDHLAGPLVMVGTTVDGDLAPVTAVTGGIAFVNTNTAEFFTSDSLAEYQHTDGSFDIVDYTGGEPGDGLKRPLVGRTILGLSDSPGDRKFRRWVYCFSIGSLGILSTTLMTTPPVPQLVVGRLVVQHVLLAAACAAGVTL